MESVLVPVWIRGETEVTLLNAWFGGRNKSIAALTLGSSTGTVPEGVTAEAVVVKSFDELDQRTDVSDAALARVKAKARRYINHYRAGNRSCAFLMEPE